MITPESFNELLGILGDKEKCIKSDEFIYSKKPYWNFRTDAIYFPFEARKETHEQRKTKIDRWIQKRDTLLFQLISEWTFLREIWQVATAI